METGQGWYCVKTFGPDVRAEFRLRSAGFQTFRPVIHQYFTDRRTQREKMRVIGLFPGYAFIRLGASVQRDLLSPALNVSYLLGSWQGTNFKPKEMPPEWIGPIISAGPIVQGKKLRFKKGSRVRYYCGRLGTLIAESDVEAIDKAGKHVISVEMFGKSQRVSVAPELLELVAE